MRTLKLYFFRNGLSEANVKGIYAGSTASPLSERGRSDLAQLLEEYEYPYVDCVFTSSLSSDLGTARMLYPEVDTRIIDSLKETDFGEFEGRTLEDLQNDPNFQKWAAPQGQYLPAGAEHPSDFIARVCSATVKIVNNMMAEGMTSAAVIAHMGVIGNIFSTLAYPKSDPFNWTCDPGFGYTAVADPVLFMRDPVLEITSRVPETNDEPIDPNEISDWKDDMWNPAWDKELEELQ